MNPIDKWRHECDLEEMASGRKPSICVMGCDDYAELCGMLNLIAPNILEIERFYGVKINKSYAHTRGFMFA